VGVPNGNYSPMPYNAATYLFEIFVVKRQKSVSDRPKMVHTKPFLTPHLETPIATKGKKLVLGHSSTVVQTFMLIGGTVAEIYGAIQKI